MREGPEGSEKVLGDVGPAPAPAPTTRAYLKLVEVVAVFAVLHHPAKYQQASPIAHEAIGCTSRRDVPSHGRDEPLVGRWRTKVSRSQNSSGAPRTRTSTPLPPHTHKPSKYSLRKEGLRHCLSSQGCGLSPFTIQVPALYPSHLPNPLASEATSKQPVITLLLITVVLKSRKSLTKKIRQLLAMWPPPATLWVIGKKCLTPKIPSRGRGCTSKWPKELPVQAGSSSRRYRLGRAMGVRINLYRCFPGDGPEQPSPGPTPPPAPLQNTGRGGGSQCQLSCPKPIASSRAGAPNLPLLCLASLPLLGHHPHVCHARSSRKSPGANAALL